MALQRAALASGEAAAGRSAGAPPGFSPPQVDGVYDCDPVKNPHAKLHRQLSFRDVLERGLHVMDETAITLCKENDIPGEAASPAVWVWMGVGAGVGGVPHAVLHDAACTPTVQAGAVVHTCSSAGLTAWRSRMHARRARLGA